VVVAAACDGRDDASAFFFLDKTYLYYWIRKMYKYRYNDTGYKDSCLSDFAQKALKKTKFTRRSLVSMLVDEHQLHPSPASETPAISQI
jgi:hypothetical protein